MLLARVKDRTASLVTRTILCATSQKVKTSENSREKNPARSRYGIDDIHWTNHSTRNYSSSNENAQTRHDMTRHPHRIRTTFTRILLPEVIPQNCAFTRGKPKAVLTLYFSWLYFLARRRNPEILGQDQRLLYPLLEHILAYSSPLSSHLTRSFSQIRSSIR